MTIAASSAQAAPVRILMAGPALRIHGFIKILAVALNALESGVSAGQIETVRCRMIKATSVVGNRIEIRTPVNRVARNAV